MTTLILSINWFWVRNVHKRVRTTRKIFDERHEFVTPVSYTVSFVRIWSWYAWRSVVCKNSLLQSERCAELAHENCYVISQHQLWPSCFSLTKIFSLCCQNWPRLCATDYKRNANWVINFSVGFCCVMFVSPAAVLDVYFCLVYNRISCINIKFETRVLLQIAFAKILLNILKIGQPHTE